MSEMHHIRIGVIGAGTMGLRVLKAIRTHTAFNVVGVYDPDAGARARVHALDPALPLSANPAELSFQPGLDALYVASPPARHLEHLRLAQDAGVAVLCEKPLAASLADVAAIERLVLPRCAVNFPFACVPAARQMVQMADSGVLGAFSGARITLRFSEWPRVWQRGAATWLDMPEQGGFTREVLSHFLFLALRLFGPLELVDHQLDRVPGKTETGLRARLRHALGILDIDAAVYGSVAESNCFEWRGTRGSARLRDWYGLEATGVPPIAPVDPTPYTLDAFARAFRNEAGTGLATVSEARQVAELVETLLA
jgi:predicted dehydrogenase